MGAEPPYPYRMLMNYEAYLHSQLWADKRAARLALDGHRCRLCDATEDLEVHHRPESYALIPNESVEGDLISVCRVCHELITDRVRRRRYASGTVPALHSVPSPGSTRSTHVADVPTLLGVAADSWRNTHDLEDCEASFRRFPPLDHA
jgi:hypothetical protein